MRKTALFPALLIVLASCNGGEALRLRTRFHDVQGLRPGAAIQISGVRVGTVTTIQRLGDATELTLDFPKPAPPIPNDARVRLIRAAGSGDYFIELNLARTNGPPARNGDLLPTENANAPLR